MRPREAGIAREEAMADEIRKIDYFKAQIPDKAGEGARLLVILAEAGVNLLAFTGFPRGRKAQVDFVPEDAAAFKAAARKARLAVTRKTAFLVQGDDRPGAVADLASRLAAAGINITAMDAVAAGGGRFGAILWVRPADVKKAARTLGAA
ncbi:MAG: ACT domain-containing protein [Deltaproteobacteria bacterium]